LIRIMGAERRRRYRRRTMPIDGDTVGRPLRPPISRILETRWHAVPADEALRLLRTGEPGLDEAEVLARREIFGENALPRRPRPGALVVYLRQFKSPLIYLLLAAAAVSLAIGEFTDAAFIFVVLQVNALIGAIQESRAAASAEALDTLVQHRAVARRNGVRTEIDGVSLVPGDIVEIAAGAAVPADIRLLHQRDLKIDESLLTGESTPVAKRHDATLRPDATLGDRTNLLHAGSTVLTGRALGVTVRTGLHTEIGRIAQAMEAAEAPPPPLVGRLERFSRRVGYAMVAVILLLGMVQLFRGMTLTEVFFVAVALAVAAIPEGLPVAITVALAIATRRMARRNVIVRQLPAVEGLGACTIVASDKTGTLTVNQLTARRLYLPGVGDLDVGGEGYAPEGEILRDGRPAEPSAIESARRLALSGALCNEATYEVDKDGVRHLGDTVDVAFLALAAKLGLNRAAILASHPQIEVIPYEPLRRFAASFNLDGDTSVAHVKGAAETIIPMCAGFDAAALLDRAGRMAADGYRVLAVARGELSGTAAAAADTASLASLEFLGLVGLIDPLRPEAAPAVQNCRGAGVAVCMVTGDHPATALAIARDLGIADDESDVVTGGRLAELGDDRVALDAVVAEARVFARVEPIQKLMLVQALQRLGHFVAVTGDGVNDVPALGAANIGVAMGRDGTDIARGAADLILTDDNFASIVGGVEEGRIAYDNVRKLIYLLVTTGVGELVLFLLAIAVGLPLPIFAVQLLWLNLVTNGIQDVALAFEKGEPGVLNRRPRPPRQPIFDRRMIEQVALMGAWMGIAAFGSFWYLLDSGVPEADARNLVLLLMVLFENVHAFNARSERRSAFRIPFAANPFLVLAVIAAQGLHIAAMYTPGLSDVLGVMPISFSAWLTVAGVALSLLIVAEVYKVWRHPEDSASGAGSPCSGSTRSR
jgi:magnesium-transporting ATPase (P-type)